MNYTNQAVGIVSSVMGGVPVPVAPDTLQNLIKLIGQQSSELAQRATDIAIAINGTVPESAEKEMQQEQPTLIHQLRLISRTLGRALSEAERAQRFL